MSAVEINIFYIHHTRFICIYAEDSVLLLFIVHVCVMVQIFGGIQPTPDAELEFRSLQVY